MRWTACLQYRKEGETGLRIKQEVDEAVEEDAGVDGAHVPRVLVQERLGPQRGRHKCHDQVLQRPACAAKGPHSWFRGSGSLLKKLDDLKDAHKENLDGYDIHEAHLPNGMTKGIHLHTGTLPKAIHACASSQI